MRSISPAEERALTALYRQCGGEDWLRRDGWLSDADPCTWEGITCERRRVTRLNLARNRLQGTLPSEIGLLAYLEQIDLSGNALTGSIPAELGNLSRLSQIDLSNNDLQGVLPERLRLLRGLRRLDLHGNRLNGSIPAALHDLTALETLDLSHNRLTGAVPPELGRLTRLIALRLDHNDLRGPLPLELVALAALDTFTFDHTGLLEPPNPAFQGWLESIERLGRTGVLYAEVVRSSRGDGGGNLPLAALAGMGTFGALLTATFLVLLPFIGPAAAVVASLAGVAGGGLAGKRVYELTAQRSAAAAALSSGRDKPGGILTYESDEELRTALTRELRALVRATRTDLPADIAAEVSEIETTLLDLLPRIERLSGGDADAYVVRQTIRDYLPEALAPYRALPHDFATQQPIQAGKTAHEHLLQQLQALHNGLREIAERLPEKEARRLLVHGRFLEGKFRHADPEHRAESPFEPPPDSESQENQSET